MIESSSDTINRAMYWTEANRDYIGKANMLGQNVQKIVATKVYQPFSITIAGRKSHLHSLYLACVHKLILKDYYQSYVVILPTLKS